jgi:hypothetical protein
MKFIQNFHYNFLLFLYKTKYHHFKIDLLKIFHYWSKNYHHFSHLKSIIVSKINLNLNKDFKNNQNKFIYHLFFIIFINFSHYMHLLYIEVFHTDIAILLESIIINHLKLSINIILQIFSNFANYIISFIDFIKL